MKKNEVLSEKEEAAVLRYRKRMAKLEAEMRSHGGDPEKWVGKAVDYYMDNYDGKYIIYTERWARDENCDLGIQITQIHLDREFLTRLLTRECTGADFIADPDNSFEFNYRMNEVDGKQSDINSNFKALKTVYNENAVIRLSFPFTHFYNPYIPESLLNWIDPNRDTDEFHPITTGCLLDSKEEFDALIKRIKESVGERAALEELFIEKCPVILTTKNVK